MNRPEARLERIDKWITEIDVQHKAPGLPKQIIFFNGQIFDANVFASELIKKAKSSINLMDNDVDETVLTLLASGKKMLRQPYSRKVLASSEYLISASITVRTQK